MGDPGPDGALIPGPAPYRPLRGSEIRLLRVAPGGWDDQVSCTMDYVPLDGRPEYVALSYTWGDASDQVDIVLDGHGHRATRSLFTALRRFRQLCSEGQGLDGFRFSSDDGIGSTYIWADALSINQADDREKEREIPRMRDVYTLCSRVCVWLGENDDAFGDSAENRATLDEIERWLGSSGSSVVADVPTDRVLPTTEERRPLQREIEDHFGRDRVEAVLEVWCKLAGRAWFTRVWVIQEAALPAADPIMMAGGHLFGFERFTCVWAVISLMLTSRDAAADTSGLVHHGALFRSRIQAQQHPIQTETDGDLEERRARFGRAFGEAMVRQGPGGFQATNPHDYLYSMIGLCGGGALLPPELAPDYQKPFPQVCEEYARCVIKATGSVAILGRRYCDLYWDYETDLRPWVPDFRATQIPISVKGDVDLSAVSFVGPDERYLKVRGFDVGEVMVVYNPLEYEDDDDFSFGEHLRHHHKFLVEVSQERNRSPQDAVSDWLTRHIVTADAWTADLGVEDVQGFYDYCLWQGEEDDGDSDGANSRAGSLLQDSNAAETFVQLTRNLIYDKKSVLCEGGVVAAVDRIGGETPQRGDRLVALSGSRCPFLLRPLLTPEGQGYVFLSHCWAYDGASKLNYSSDDFSLEFFDESEFEDFMLV